MDAVVEVKHGAASGAEPRFARTWREFAESRAALVGLGVIVLMFGLAVLAPLVTPVK